MVKIHSDFKSIQLFKECGTYQTMKAKWVWKAKQLIIKMKTLYHREQGDSFRPKRRWLQNSLSQAHEGWEKQCALKKALFLWLLLAQMAENKETLKGKSIVFHRKDNYKKKCIHWNISPVVSWQETSCHGMKCMLQKDMLKPEPLVPVDVTLFGKRIFGNVIKWR